MQQTLTDAPPRRPQIEPPFDGLGVEIDDVVFVPPGARRLALKSIDLRIAPGEAVGIVGPSGAGKSCLARLIVAAGSPIEGKVTIGGLDSRHWSREMLARNIGYLPQTVGLFPGTLRDNIARFGAASDDAVIQAAIRRADVHQMILDLP